MIGISSYLYYPDGGRVFRPDPSGTSLRNRERRISRSKTLDGGVYVNDLGFTVGDSTMTVKVELSSDADYTFFEDLLKLYPRVVITTEDGAYDAYVQQVTVEGNRATITVLPVSEVS